MPMLDLSFPLLGATLPTDHGYELYGALSRLVPALHDGLACRVAPVRGTYAGNGVLQLDRRYSALRLRLAPELLPQVLSLAGKGLGVGGHRLRLGVPHVSALVPAAILGARLVTISVAKEDRAPAEPQEFLDAVRRQLGALGIAGDPSIPLVEGGPHAGKPRRRVLRIKDRRIVGFAVHVTGLSGDGSIRLQENGLGRRSKMGCGFFVPVKEGTPS